MNTKELRKAIELIENIFGELKVFIYAPGENGDMTDIPITTYVVDYVNGEFALVLDTYVEEDE